jgi:hypothetical protein
MAPKVSGELAEAEPLGGLGTLEAAAYESLGVSLT